MRALNNKLTRLICGASLMAILSGCSLLPSMGKSTDNSRQVYFVEPQLPAPAPHVGDCGDLLVGELNAAPGFRSARIAYTTAPLKIEYYAHSRWAASFGLLLASPLKQALQNSGRFAHVVASPTAASADMRLEFADLKVIQHFVSPDADTSTVSLQIEARLLQTSPLKLLDSRRFELQAAAAPNPGGGVKIANELAARLINEISTFAVAVCAEL